MGGYSAYQSMQRAAASPIQTEADVMGKITHEIEAYKEKGGPEFVKALYRNVQLWNAFSADLLSTDNQLPDQLKASLVSLSIWVEKHTHKVVSGTADVAALIDVNRSVLKGLMTAGQTPNPQTAGAQATGPQTAGLQETAPAASAPAAPAAARPAAPTGPQPQAPAMPKGGYGGHAQRTGYGPPPGPGRQGGFKARTA